MSPVGFLPGRDRGRLLTDVVAAIVAGVSCVLDVEGALMPHHRGSDDDPASAAVATNTASAITHSRRDAAAQHPRRPMRRLAHRNADPRASDPPCRRRLAMGTARRPRVRPAPGPPPRLTRRSSKRLPERATVAGNGTGA